MPASPVSGVMKARASNEKEISHGRASWQTRCAHFEMRAVGSLFDLPPDKLQIGELKNILEILLKRHRQKGGFGENKDRNKPNHRCPSLRNLVECDYLEQGVTTKCNPAIGKNIQRESICARIVLGNLDKVILQRLNGELTEVAANPGIA